MSIMASTALISGCSLKLPDQTSLNCHSMNLFVKPIGSKKATIPANSRRSACQAILRGDSGRTSSSSIFVGGFLLGGIVVGTIGCVYAPKIIRALNEADSKDIMKKLPKFIYDEDTVLERTRKKLADKIEQLNTAIDGISFRFRTDGVFMESDEIDAGV